MSYDYIQQYYKVPAEHGRRVRYTDGQSPKEGVICGSTNQYIHIHFDGDKKPRGPFHPTCGIEYLGMGDVPKLTRSQERYARYRSVADCFDSFASFLHHEKQERHAKACGFSSVSDYEKWLRTI